MLVYEGISLAIHHIYSDFSELLTMWIMVFLRKFPDYCKRKYQATGVFYVES